MVRNRFSGAALLCAVLAAQPACAALVHFSDQASFRAAMSYTVTDQFADLAAGSLLAPPLVRGSGAASYRASAVDLAGLGPGQGAEALYVLDSDSASSGNWLGTNFASSALLFSGFGGAVHGIGGSFFGTEFDGMAVNGPLILHTVDAAGGVFDFTFNGGFAGFASDAALVSLTVTSSLPTFATAAALEAGVVPESGMPLLLAAGAGALLLARRRS